MQKKIKEIFSDFEKLSRYVSENYIDSIVEITELAVKTINSNNKIILFGNGGSAADSQHIACELVGRFKTNRKPLPAIALTTNTSNLTAIGNDFGFNDIFKRQVDALTQKGDLVWGFTTSGNSENVIEGIKSANNIGAKTLIFTGGDGGKIKDISDVCLIVPSDDTPRIQEFHIFVGHIICEIVEKNLYS